MEITFILFTQYVCLLFPLGFTCEIESKLTVLSPTQPLARSPAAGWGRELEMLKRGSSWVEIKTV